MNAIVDVFTVDPVQLRVVQKPDISPMVEAIGCPEFSANLLAFMSSLGSVERLSLFEQHNYELSEIAPAGKDDQADTDGGLYEIRSLLSRMGRLDSRIELCPTMRGKLAGDQRQRILVCARRGEYAYCIRLVLTPDAAPVTDDDLAALRRITNFLISLVAKHAELTLRRPALTPALRSLDDIESCLTTGTELSRREAEVCARILYGLSSCGIAVDLGIGKESVMTYRKRAYSRLGIGSQRELLMWYLSLWSTAPVTQMAV